MVAKALEVDLVGVNPVYPVWGEARSFPTGNRKPAFHLWKSDSRDFHLIKGPLAPHNLRHRNRI